LNNKIIPHKLAPTRAQPLRLLFSDLRVTVALTLLSLITGLILLGPWIAPDPSLQNLSAIRLPPSTTHWLGTDDLGRDVWARVLLGGRLSLAVGLVATLVSMVVGTLYGSIAGYFGGKCDLLLMRLVDILYCLPYMFLVIILMIAVGKNILALFISLGLVQWLTVARMVRGQVLSLKTEEYISAARSLGVRPLVIIGRHLLPGVRPTVLVYATLTVPGVILQEAFLSFLGLSVHPCTWGVLIAEGADQMSSAWWLLAAPGFALSITLLALNFLGDGLRDQLEARSRREI